MSIEMSKKIIYKFCLLICLIFLPTACTQFSTFLADKIYPHLKEPYREEVPSTAFSFLPSSETIGVIGGRGEGLNCSLPPLTEWLAFSDKKDYLKNNDAPISLQFRQACVSHDYCYRHGEATYGYSQANCDFTLQEQAYRLCMQIFKNTEVKNCESYARRILLGVRIGGGNSFRTNGNSTYFEYDTAPEKANDYTVSRLVKLQKKLEVIGNSGEQDALIRSVFSFHIKNGGIASRILTWCQSENCMFQGEQGNQEPLYLPDYSIPTPPQLTTINNQEFLVFIARNSSDNTSKIISKYLSLEEQLSYNLRSFESLNPFAKDHDSSIAFLKKDSGLISFSHRYKNDNNHPVIYCDELDGGSCVNKQLLISSEGHDLYRFLQTSPILGSFISNGKNSENEMLLISRGKNREGDDYEQKVRAVIVNLDDKKEAINSFELNLPEKSEPFSPIPIDDNTTGILSIVNDGNVNMEVRNLRKCSKQEHDCLTIMPMSNFIDGSWLKMPMQILRSQTVKNGNLLFFYKVEVSNNSKSPKVNFRFQYIRLEQDELSLVGKGICTIDINKQIKLIENIGKGKNLKSFIKGKDEVGRSEYQEIIERWKSSQIIAGHIFDRSISNKRDLLDVAIVFKGYPELSLLLRGEESEKGVNNFSAFSPSYVSCSSERERD